MRSSRLRLPQSPIPRRRTSTARRITFNLFLLVLVSASVELICWISISIFCHETVGEIRRNRESRVELYATTDLQRYEANHPYVGWTRNPDSNRPDVFEGRHYHPNAFGLIDTHLPLRKRSANKVIVAVAGGSVAWQMSATGVNAFQRELERQPRFQGKQIELVRLAVSGYKQPQQLMLLAYLLSLGAEFDILVNIDGYNEVVLHPTENAAGQIFAPYPRSWQTRQLEVGNLEQIRAMAKFVSTLERRRTWTRICSGLPGQRSATVNFIWVMVDQSYFATETRLRQDLLHAHFDAPGYQVVGPSQAFRNTDEMFVFLVEYWANCSRQMNLLCQANDIEYFHVLPPNQHLAESKPFVDETEQRVALFESATSRAANQGYPLLVQKGKLLLAHGLAFHDLTQLFARTEAAIYIDDCCHYNETGNQQLARAVALIIGQK